MKAPTNKNIVIIVAAIIILALVVGVWWVVRDVQKATQPGGEDSGINGPSASDTRQDVPSGTTVPDQNTNVSGDVARPDAVTAAAPGVDSKKRTFKINIDNNKFDPSTVIVYAGDIAHIEFTAVDKNYDIVQPDYGFRLDIAKGQTRLIEGQYNSTGKYIFYCESCGGLEGGVQGYVIVVPKQ